MVDYIVLGAKYGLIGATTVGVFAVCVCLLLPVVLLAVYVVGTILNIGGKSDGKV